jgi:hypothetical protein
VDSLTDQDKAALFALITRYTRTQKENAALVAEQAAIAAKLNKGREQIQKYIGAFSVFGFNIAKDGGGFQQIRNLLGSKAYLEAFSAGGLDPSQTTTKDEDSGAVEQQLMLPPSTDETDQSSVREMALAKLTEASVQGTTASEIRDHIEKVRGTKLHSKTVGMTLYRLSQDGLARREGRTWFAVPQVAEKANPGG